MKTKILKIELIILFALSVISIFYYFFGTNLPDNSLSISSNSTDYFTFLYYFSSLFAEITYYVGPWIAIPFFCFAFVYHFIISTRDRSSDIFIAIIFVALFYSLTFFLAPNFLGDGLKIISESYSDVYISFGSAIIFGFISFYLTLRGAFFQLLRRVQKSLELLGFKIIRKLQQVSKKSKRLAIGYKGKVSDINIKLKTKEILKNSDLKKKKTEEVELLNIETNENGPSLTAKKIANDDEEVVQKKNKENKKGSKQEELKVAPVVDNFFKSNDLINCISASINHNHGSGPTDGYFNSIISAIENKLTEFKLDGKIINIFKRARSRYL